MFDGLVGQEIARKYLRSAVSSGCLAHAYLFFGLAGVGKKTLARMLAQQLICAGGGDRPCDQCPPCRMLTAGTHPDLFVLDGAETPIGINQIRQLQQGLRYQPYGTRHLCLIQEAEGMTAEAANALLKTLEEPMGPALFILTSSRPDRLLPTVISRCLKIPFRPLTRNEITDGLGRMGFKGDSLSAVAGLAGGSLGRAAALAAGGDGPERRDRAAALAGELFTGPGPATLFERARDMGERAELLTWTEALLFWYRDLLLWRETGSPQFLVNADRLEQIREQARLGTTPVLVRNINAVEDVRRKLQANANARLAAEILCLRLAGWVS